jgi:hypothetical protein
MHHIRRLQEPADPASAAVLSSANVDRGRENASAALCAPLRPFADAGQPVHSETRVFIAWLAALAPALCQLKMREIAAMLQHAGEDITAARRGPAQVVEKLHGLRLTKAAESRGNGGEVNPFGRGRGSGGSDTAHDWRCEVGANWRN